MEYHGGATSANIINCENMSTVHGGQRVGGISGNISGGTVESCTNNGKIQADTNAVGGIVGYNLNGDVSKCDNKNSVYSATNYSGGIIGYNSKGNVSKCNNKNSVYSAENYSGGIVGYCSGGNISYCTNNSEVETGINLAGGIAGYLSTVQANVTECENRGKIKAKGYMAGGITGRNRENTTIEKCKNYGEIIADISMNGGIVGYSSGGISYCANYGKVNSPSKSANTSGALPNSVGGIVGVLLNGEVNYVYNEGEISIQNNSDIIDVAGGIIGEIGSKTADSKPLPSVMYSYNKGIVKSDEYFGNIAGQELHENRVNYSYYKSTLDGKGIGYIGTNIQDYEGCLLEDEENVTKAISDDFNYDEFINWVKNGEV